MMDEINVLKSTLFQHVFHIGYVTFTIAFTNNILFKIITYSPVYRHANEGSCTSHDSFICVLIFFNACMGVALKLNVMSF